jgi:hypothetical protein
MMHNLVSINQLAFFNNDAEKMRENYDNDMNDYFQCLIECDDNTQTCKRICKLILTT